jgi:hypothetical protein
MGYTFPSAAKRFADRVDEQIMAELTSGRPPRPRAPILANGKQDLAAYAATLTPTVARTRR